MSDDLGIRSRKALEELEMCIEQLLQDSPEGLRNSDIAGVLGLRSSMNGSQKDYLTYSVLGLLMQQGRVVKDPSRTQGVVYRVSPRRLGSTGSSGA